MELTLERKEGRVAVTDLAPSRTSERRSPHHLNLTAMNHLRCVIPFHQQDGLVSIPQDDWSAFRALVRDHFNGTVTVSETTDGDTVNPSVKPGEPCLLVDMAIPVGPSRDEVIGVVDGPLNTLVDRNIVRNTQQQAA